MNLSKICPSLAIGFYVKDVKAFETFVQNLNRVRSMDYCFFSLFKQRQNSA